MDGFEFNKLAAAVLIALLTWKAADLIGEGVVAPQMLEKQAFEIEGVAVVAKNDDAPKGPEPVEPLLASADIKQGEKIFKKCAVCHSIDKGGPNKVGPNLYDVVDRKLAVHPGFAYSSALIDHGGAWTYDALNGYLESPRKYIPGNKMAFAGLKKVQDRADLIAYLRNHADN